MTGPLPRTGVVGIFFLVFPTHSPLNSTYMLAVGSGTRALVPCHRFQPGDVGMQLSRRDDEVTS